MFTALAFIPDLTVAALVVALFAWAFAQVARPWQAGPTGTTIRTVRLPARARLRLHGVWLLAIALVLTSATALGVLAPGWALLVVPAAALALLAYPVRYVVTDHGIAVGRTPLRRWTEFGGLSARNGWIYLQPVGGARGLLIRAPHPTATEDLAGELRRLVRASYKGHVGPYRPTVEWDRPEAPDCHGAIASLAAGR